MKEIFFNVLYISGSVVAGAFALAVAVAIFGTIADMVKDIVRGEVVKKMQDVTELYVTRQQLGLLLEAVNLLLPKKCGPLMREAMKLRAMLCKEIAAAREGDDGE